MVIDSQVAAWCLGANLKPVQHMLVLIIAVPLVLQLPGHLLLWAIFGN